MKIFNPRYTLIDGLRPKVMEVGNGFLLNTQYYLKNNLSPVPFEFTSVYGSPYHLNLKKSLYCDTYSWNRKNIENTIVQDEFVSGKYYVFTHSGYISAERRLHLNVVLEKDSTCTLMKDIINYGDHQFLSYVDQTEQYLYFITQSNKTWYLMRYDKVAHTNTTCFSLGYTYSQPAPLLVYKDAAFFFFVSYSDNNIAITRYDITNNTQITTTTYRGQMTTTGNYNCSQLLSPVQIGPNEYGAYVYNLGEPEQPLGIYSVDVTANFNTTFATACKYTPCTITWNLDKTRIDYNTATHSVSTYYRNIVRQVGNKKYMHMFVHNHNFENTNYIPYQGIYTFEMEDNENLTFLNYDNIDSTRQINGYLLDDSMNTLIIAFKRGFQIYKFSTQQEKYVYTGVELASIYDVGLDETGRLWYLKLDGSVHLANLSDAQEVDIKFERNYYEYTGSDIATHITFSAKTYLGVEATGVFELVVEGPAYFTDTRRRDINITYTQEVDVPLTITGAAPITIYPKYVNES